MTSDILTQKLDELFGGSNRAAKNDDMVVLIPKTNALRSGTFCRRQEMQPKSSFAVPMLHPERVIFQPPATIVYWPDGDKTVVRCENDEFSEEFGYAMACMRKI